MKELIEELWYKYSYIEQTSDLERIDVMNNAMFTQAIESACEYQRKACAREYIITATVCEWKEKGVDTIIMNSKIQECDYEK